MKNKNRNRYINEPVEPLWVSILAGIAGLALWVGFAILGWLLLPIIGGQVMYLDNEQINKNIRSIISIVDTRNDDTDEQYDNWWGGKMDDCFLIIICSSQQKKS